MGITYEDFLGDRVADIRVLDPGIYSDDRALDGKPLVIEFDFPNIGQGEIQEIAKYVDDKSMSHLEHTASFVLCGYAFYTGHAPASWFRVLVKGPTVSILAPRSLPR